MGKPLFVSHRSLSARERNAALGVGMGVGEPERSRRAVLELSNCVNKPLADHGER